MEYVELLLDAERPEVGRLQLAVDGRLALVDGEDDGRALLPQEGGDLLVEDGAPCLAVDDQQHDRRLLEGHHGLMADLAQEDLVGVVVDQQWRAWTILAATA